MPIGWKHYRKEIGLGVGIFIALLLYFSNPLHVAEPANRVLAISALMISWWILDAMPLAAVALIPLVLFPLLKITSLKEVSRAYADPVVFLFMGGFFLALALEKWQLHKRIALTIIGWTGTNGNRIILGFILATGFLSLWLSNTATTMMMFPIAMSVIHVITEQNPKHPGLHHFSLVLMLSIAYASNFALGTVIGTPPNVAYTGYISEKFNYTIGFLPWMIAFMPLTFVLLIAQYIVLVKWLFPNRLTDSSGGRAHIKSEQHQLGPVTSTEKRVLWVFGLTVLGWISKDLLNEIQSWLVFDDTIIAMAGGLILFALPSGRRASHPRERLLAWEDTYKMAWGILLLFGGGIALAKALEEAKLLEQLGQYMAGMNGLSPFWLILIVTTVSIFLSEVMSNVAQVIVMAPVITTLALTLNIDPLLLGIPMTLGASCASMLPMGTPPNAIVFASGRIKISDMLRAGFILNLISALLIALFCWGLQQHVLHL
jgi:sodium-dependent dicarboxylate transporter 2/3/5